MLYCMFEPVLTRINSMKFKNLSFSVFKLFLTLPLVFLFVYGVQPLQKHQLTLKVTGIKEVKGELVIGIYNNQKDWLKKGKEFFKKRVKITSKEESIVFDNIPAGEYAISMYHDENSDGKVNRKLTGYPKEGTGFSNGAKITIKAPGFKKASFSVIGNKEEIIALKY